MLKRPYGRIQALSLALDGVCVIAAFVAAVTLREYHSELPLLGWIPEVRLRAQIGQSTEYRAFLLISLPLWLALIKYIVVRNGRRNRTLSSVASTHLMAAVLCALGTGFVTFALKLETISRLFVLYYFSLSYVLLVLKQIAELSFLRHLRRRGYGVRRVLILGDAASAAEVIERLTADPDANYQVVRVIVDEEFAAIDRPWTLSEPDTNVSEVDDLAIVPAGRSLSETAQRAALLFLLHGKSVHIACQLVDDRLRGQKTADVLTLPVLSLAGTGPDAVTDLGKRIFDIVGAILLLVVSLPVATAVAVVVKITSPGPILFVQERLGKGGKRFRLYKFRTMRPDAEEVLHADPALYAKYLSNNYKLPDDEDERITAIGRFLRKTSLDELPQLINVVMGDMSLVGPRPIVPPEVVQYGEYALLLLSVRPGITGHWQVSGRQPVDYAVRSQLDLEYIIGRSVWVDVGILLRTVPTMVRGRGVRPSAPRR